MYSGNIVACGMFKLLVEGGRVRSRSPMGSDFSVALAG